MLPTATTKFITLIDTSYKFWTYWPSAHCKYRILTLKIKYIYVAPADGQYDQNM